MMKSPIPNGEEALKIAFQIEKDVKPDWANCEVSEKELTALSYTLLAGIGTDIRNLDDVSFVGQIIGYAYLLGRRKMAAEMLLGGKNE